jgi:hypothetical protein
MADLAAMAFPIPTPFQFGGTGEGVQDPRFAAGGGSIAVHLDRVLKSKRSFPVIPTERTQVFTG